MNPVNPINPNESDLFESIRMIKKNSVSFGLIGLFRIDRIHSDCKYELILNNRIDRIHSDWFGLKNFFRLGQNETVWFGYKFQNESEKVEIGSEWISIRNFRQGNFLGNERQILIAVI